MQTRELLLNSSTVTTMMHRDTTLRVQTIGGKLPTRATGESAGLYLYAMKEVEIAPHARSIIPLGIKIEVPMHTCGKILPIPKHAPAGIQIVPLIVERGDTNELQIEVINTSDITSRITPEQPCAQIILERIASADIEEVSQL